MKRGTIGLRPGPIMASTSDFTITVKGKGGHAAIPHINIDPVPVAAQIVMAMQTIVSRRVDPVDQAVVSVTNINAGSGATNVIPDAVVMTGTYRTFRMETRAMIGKRIEQIASAIAAAHDCTANIELETGYDPTINSPLESAFCAEVARALVGDANVNANVEPCMGAEDFGAMLQEVPGCYIWMGQAEDDADSPHNKGLHNVGYDFNDEIIPLGIEYWARLVESALPR
jgi:hippurate hydrolase